ncbi:MAG: CHAT domain-containing protein, partial [Bacteroidota bacterium]
AEKGLNEQEKAFLETAGARISELRTAQQTFFLGIDLLLDFRMQCVDAESRIILSENSHVLFAGAVKTSFELFRLTGDRAHLLAAFHSSERARGLNLQEARRKVEVLGSLPIPPGTLDKIKGLQRDLAFYQGKALREEARGVRMDSTKFETWKSLVFDLREKLQMLEAEAKKAYPEFADYQSEITTLNAGKIADSLLNVDELLIEIFQSSTEVFVFGLSKHNFTARVLPFNSAHQRLLQSYVRSISNYEFIHDSTAHAWRDFTRSAHALYQILLAPELREHPGIRSLTVVPDGPYHFVPFESFLTALPTDSSVQFNALPYLLNDLDVQYADAGSLLPFPTKPTHLPEARCLAIAGSYANRPNSPESGSLQTLRDQAGNLPGAHAEVQAIASQGFAGRFLLGKRATEAQFKSQASDYSILHLALHGVSDPAEPLNSHIMFSPESDTTEDGNLYAHEIAGLTQSSDLVVLSACETGAGKIRQGEGAM